MSSILNTNNNDYEGDWEQANNKKNKNKNRKIETSSVQTIPIQTSPIQTSPLQANPVQANPVQADPKATVNPTPVETNQVQSNPTDVKENIPSNMVDNDVYQKWFLSMENVKGNNDMFDHWFHSALRIHREQAIHLFNMRNYIQLPTSLKFKNDSEQKHEMYFTLGNLINTFQNDFFNELKTQNKFLPTMTVMRLVQIIVGKFSIIQCLEFFNNKNELTNTLKNICEDIYNSENQDSVPVQPVVKESITAPVQPVVKESTTVPVQQVVKESTKPVQKTVWQKKVTTPVKNDTEYYLKKNKALMEAQELFFKDCVPSAEKIKEVKALLDLNGKKSVKSNTISLKNDDIKIGTFTFSKRHFLTNAFFVNKVTKEYVNIYSDKYWIKLIQNLKYDGELIIMLDINHKKDQKNINI
jgi:hypothetical protein